MLHPLFHRRMVAGFACSVAAANDRLIESVARAGGERHERQRHRRDSRLAVEVILSAVFGEDLNDLSQQSGGNPFDFITTDRARDLPFAYRLRSLTKLVAGLVERRRAAGVDRADYLGMLMAARDVTTGSPMDDRQLLDEVLTIVLAGHETTASALNWTWLLLASEAEVDRRLRAEISAKPQPAVPALAQLESLGYTRQVLSEALRLYPPGWLLSRRTIEADVLGGYDVPAGADVLLPIYLIHRDARHWPEPGVFRPERFAPDGEATRPRFAYAPFAAGARRCLGETFAWYRC